MYNNRLAAALGAALLTISLAGCGSDASSDNDASDPTSTSDVMTADNEAATLTVQDPWVMAAEKGMTAAFGTLVNSGDSDVVVTSATSDITSAMELHETVQNDDGTMAMQPKKGGFTIPAGGEHELAPGGDHLMVMNLDRALKPGESVTIKLEMEDGSTTEIDAVVKKFTGADEKYQNGDMGAM